MPYYLEIKAVFPTAEARKEFVVRYCVPHFDMGRCENGIYEIGTPIDKLEEEGE